MSVLFDLLAEITRRTSTRCALWSPCTSHSRRQHTRRERRSSVFPLEREVAVSRTNRTLGLALLVLLIMGATWAATEYLFPRLATTEALTTPAPEDLIVPIDTPTITPLPPTATPTTTPTPQARPTRRPSTDRRPYRRRRYAHACRRSPHLRQSGRRHFQPWHRPGDIRRSGSDRYGQHRQLPVL